MAILSKLLVALGLDATDYQKGLDGVESTTSGKLSTLGSKLSGIGKKATETGGKLTAGVTVPILAMGVKAIDAASDLDESMSKVRVVFGDSAESVIAFSESSATAFGISQQGALEAAGTYGNLFSAMGIGADATEEMSTGLVGLAADLASFNNASPEETLEALRAGLTGETEPLKRFGVNLTAAQVANKALDLGLVETSVDMNKVQKETLGLEKAQAKLASMTEGLSGAELEAVQNSIEYREAQVAVTDAQGRLDEALAGTAEELTSAQKAQATYALIMEQTTLAQGDFARTSEGMANSSRIAKAQLADAAATIGTQLLPIGLKLVNFVSDLIGKFANLSPETQKVILIVAGLAAALGPLLMVLGSVVSAVGAIMPLLGGIVAVISGPVLAVIAAIVAAVALFVAAWKNDWFGIRTTLTEVWENTIKPALTMLWEWLKVKVPEAIATLKRFWDEVLLPAIRRIWSFIETNLIPLFRALGRLIKVTLAKAIEILTALWENVLLPAIRSVWEFIETKLIPIFKSIAAVVEDRLGPVMKWLKEHIIDPVASAFSNVSSIIQDIIGWINDLITKISSIELPSWLQSNSPTPLEIGLTGINDQFRQMSETEIPAVDRALAGLGANRFGAALGAGAGALGGDQIVIHNHDRTSAAITETWIRDRSRARLNFSMGGSNG